MKKHVAFPLFALLAGAAAFALRLAQNRTGFEVDTGLPIAGNVYAWVLPVVLAVMAAVFFLLSRKLPGETGETPLLFPDYFRADGALPVTILVTGLFLWLLSGAYGIYAGLLVDFSRIEMLCGILTVLSAGCLFPVVSACRRATALNENLVLAPVVYLVIRLVLAYRADSINPALGAYYVEMLALAFLILAFYRASSFAFHAGRTRRFAVYAALAIMLGCATLADSHTISDLLLYGGSVIMVLGLLFLRLNSAQAAPSAPDSGETSDSAE
ncbi:MAG: hypothetical protein LKJ86_03435 [Oscillibacter sp.]|jgi:hypothetical protein|nr:hypothetical protein [Oscillibacter sp.]